MANMKYFLVFAYFCLRWVSAGIFAYYSCATLESYISLVRFGSTISKVRVQKEEEEEDGMISDNFTQHKTSTE